MKQVTLLFAILTTISLTAQRSSKENKGDKYYDLFAFNTAIEKYEKADELTVSGKRNLAKSYYNTGEYVSCELIYESFINSSETVPEDYFNYASVLKMNGHYEEADGWMKKFTIAAPNDHRAKKFISGNSILTKVLIGKDNYSINNLDVNTKEQDFGPTFYNNQIVFASTREGFKSIKRSYNWNELPFLDLYVANKEGKQLSNPVSLNKKFNNKMHEGPASFANEGKLMAFTRNNYENKSEDGKIKLQIFFAEKQDDENWDNAVPFYLNDPNYSVGHPSLSENGSVMYFASDMPGGVGGVDIYKVEKKSDDTWGKPINLGSAVNTEADELFPFYHGKRDMLFFSSKGLPGIGGLDLFVSKANEEGTFLDAQNMGMPLNTKLDDFALIIDSEMESGYFSSNREGGKGDDDIYAFDVIIPLTFYKTIQGVAQDDEGHTLSNTTITLLDKDDVLIETVITGTNGNYQFIVPSDKDFVLCGTKDEYLDGNNKVSTQTEDVAIIANLVLQSEAEKVIENETLIAELIAINPIYFDFNKYNIRSDAKEELDKIVVLMNEHPSMEIELGSHTDCRAPKKYNKKLSSRRAKSSADYIKSRISNPNRIYGKGYGESELISGCPCEGEIASTCSEEDHQLNRRTEFKIIKM